jgi:small subunit ribosomal protein S1
MRAERKALRKFSAGQIVYGTVDSITDYGAFIHLWKVDGLLHISEMSRDHLETPGQVVTVGQRVKVMVLSVDREKARLSLSMKRLPE